MVPLLWTPATFAVGLMLWVAGGGIIRPSVGAVGLGLGALGGWLAWLETGIGPAWALPASGAVITCCVALLAWHLASGVLLCASAGLLAGAVAWGSVHLMQPAEIATPPVAALFGLEAPDTASDASPSLVPVAFTPIAGTPPASLNPDALADAAIAARAGALAKDVADHEQIAPVRAAWTTVPAEQRFVILIATAGAALLGLVIAALAQSTAAILLTSICGALMMVSAVPRMLNSFGVADLGISANTAVMTALGAWALLSLAGIGIQTARRTGATPPAAPAPSPA